MIIVARGRLLYNVLTMKKIIIFIALVGVYLSLSTASYAQCVPPATNFIDCFRAYTDPSQDPLDASSIVEIIETIAGFLIVAGGIIAGIILIWSGIMYMGAGSDPTKVTAAKAFFKNGLIGALILFAVGLILNTVALIAMDPFGFFY